MSLSCVSSLPRISLFYFVVDADEPHKTRASQKPCIVIMFNVRKNEVFVINNSKNTFQNEHVKSRTVETKIES